MTIEAVTFNELDWEPEEDDEIPEGSYLYFITFTKGAFISIEASGGSSPIPSGDDEPTPQPGPSGGDSEQGGQDEQPTPAKKGCGGSIIATSAIISLTAVLGAGLLFLKKKEK